MVVLLSSSSPTAAHARHGEQIAAVIQRALRRAMDATLVDGLAALIEAAVEEHRVDVPYVKLEAHSVAA